MALRGQKEFPERADLRLEGTTVVRRHQGHARTTVEWIHAVLDQLAGTGFPAPRPVRRFDGRSVAVIEGAVWSAVSYVPGEVIGWSDQPGLFELGAFLATFHRAAASIRVERQQHPVFPVESLPGLEEDLAAIGHDARSRQLIHGDFTNHNVVACGVPPAPCGAIDFMNACVEVALFDIGCALWRSGRPSQDAHEFTPHRIRGYVEGYSSVLPLSDDDRLAVLVYLKARGVQIVVKQAARGLADTGPERRLAWLAAHWDQMVSDLIP